MSRRVMSVTGPVDVDDLGVVMPHEHLIANAHSQWIYPENRDDLAHYTQPYSATLHGEVQLEPFSFRSAMQQLDLDVAREELETYLGAGGGTVVDLGIPGFGRDPAALKALSELTGATVIMGCGEYVEHSHSPYVRHSSAEVVRDVLLHEIEFGVGNTGVRPGIIGEIGTGNPPTSEERKVVCGAAMARWSRGSPESASDDLPGPARHAPPGRRDPRYGCRPAQAHRQPLRRASGAGVRTRARSPRVLGRARHVRMEQWAMSARRGDEYPDRAFDHHRIDLLIRLLDEASATACS